ncbi:MULTISPECIES: GNAT family N-acetyltransferase [Ralstonia solanacearum species complex]|uniref:GNAT family N-acetyltransferase n=1 Tax=Ralstonia solanacearum species complex TaxID=3116862 RepID=UPI000E56A2DB|nr:GNAT family N-acetyltransferase [Ralstonia solanacearum]BEU71343.1 GNAT family N-acetyltransferase [Ralstonia pseudosolanacearum]AXV76305.1 GNAT family N-acetyltransferase [Ralstonia solanacearum]AXV90314.1 GNAT family N-acetyltransferase [Ralstonia solanacearum]AXW18497.1 GNAT family N-acetyltransferase [Ralstonia solanacearum]AXW61379.1 GNAT family N-acetyltransferase [Ralstonia solanacearum]
MAATHVVPATGIVLSDDPAWLPLDQVYRFLSEETHWARDLPRVVFDRAIAHSLAFGAYRLREDGTHGELVGFARVISDYATFAYLCDVFVLPDWRGKRISHALMDFLREHPGLQSLRRTVLVTTDAAWLYRKHGFTDVPGDGGFMQQHRPDVYRADTGPIGSASA